MTVGLHVSIQRKLGHFDLKMEFTAEREVLVLFGPSGSGKSQTLNSIAGLNHPDSGVIELDGEVFFRRNAGDSPIDVPTRHRHVGYVFQQYALFPHLTALENIAFSFRRTPEASAKAMEWLRRMRIEGLASRYPHEVSGGQQQRIAIARALAAEPRVLLLDEPFSALDYPLRQQLHEELLRLQEQSRLIVIYVTHNLDEALAMGQRLAIVRSGQVEQIGATSEVVTNPCSPAVAEIVGMPNVFEARVVKLENGEIELDWRGLRLIARGISASDDNQVSGYIIPDAFSIDREGSTTRNETSQLRGTIKRKHFTLRNTVLRIGLANGEEIEVFLPLREGLGVHDEGEAISLALEYSGVRLFPAREEKQRNIRKLTEHTERDK